MAATPPADTTRLTVHFVKSLVEVLATMAATTVTVGKPIRKTDLSATYDVSGIIGFSGDFVGSMVLSFQEKTALAIVAAFAGQECAVNSPEFSDAIGELANMVAGSAKTAFGGTNISIPTVVVGAGHTVSRMQDIPCILIPCTVPGGEFAVEVNVKSVRSAAAPAMGNKEVVFTNQTEIVPAV